jgi:hypothetical protein
MGLMFDSASVDIKSTPDPSVFICTLDICDYTETKQDWEQDWKNITFRFNPNMGSADFVDKGVAAYNATLKNAEEVALKNTILTDLAAFTRTFARTNPVQPGPQPVNVKIVAVENGFVMPARVV